MKEIDEIKASIGELFKSVNDPETLKKLGSFDKQCDDANSAVLKKDKEYTDLLNNYKDVVIHSSTPSDGKPDVKETSATLPSVEDALTAFMADKSK